MTNVLTQGLELRQQKVQVAKDYLARTQTLFEQFGSQELKTSHARFTELLSALNSDSIRLVVLGEFSRGKSSLVNALLGIELLPTSMEATTAINTFVRALPEGLSDRFIRIHFQDGRPAQEISWSDDTALEKWGTELDTANADARKTLDYIEVFMDHPLLAKGMVLVDTPGLKSVMAHHEAITRKAIAEAHIALWVQNTTQLGGAATEWEFLSDTIRNNFRKFVTVIGWWDKVLDPDDSRDKRKSLEERTSEKLDIVRQNFRKYLNNSEEVEQLTNTQHLIPVSARWAINGNTEQKRQSGIDVLSQRIAEMFTSGEALEQVYSKPLQQLSHIQRQLSDNVADQLQQLATDKTLEERARDLETLDQDIKLLHQEADAVTRDSREEHTRVANVLVEEVKRSLIQPLTDLKADIENQVDIGYVKRQVEKRVTNIGLPDALNQRFQVLSQDINDTWSKQRQKISAALTGLSADYSKQMEKHTGRLTQEMSKLDVQVPSLDISQQLDFSAIEQHHRQAMELEKEIQARNQQINELDKDIDKHGANNAQLETAKQALARSERELHSLGGQPSPETRYRRKCVRDGGMYGSDEYADVPYTDDSNVRTWRAERDKIASVLADKETRLAEIMAEEERKTGIRMSLEKAQKKYEREVNEFERKKAAFEQKALVEQETLIQETAARLVRNTAGQLEQRIRYLENNVSDAIQKAFSDQLAALQTCVEEQFFEPLNAKRASREQIQHLLQQDEATITQRHTQLVEAQRDLADLLALTQNALHA